MVLLPRESGKLISKLAQHVKIRQGGVERLGDLLVKKIESGQLSYETFANLPLHPKSTDSHAVEWFFVVNTLNYCFWHHEKEKGWEVDGQHGYFALCAAINRALRENVDILNPSFYGSITEQQLQAILRSDTSAQIPLIAERVISLREAGTCLIEKFGGSFANCIKQAQHSAAKLLTLITDNFKCFQDEAVYKGNHVALYKRAQILIGDVWVCLQNEGLGHFTDIDQLTMFADYRVPQSLLYYGVLEYSDELMNALKTDTLLPNGTEMEVEIRGCSIEAVERLKEYAISKLSDKKSINSVTLDHFLWHFRRDHAKQIHKQQLPYHKTVCIYY